MDRQKIEEEERKCLAACDHEERPFTCIAAFLEKLSRDPSWTDAEILELQTNVVRVVLREVRKKAT